MTSFHAHQRMLHSQRVRQGLEAVRQEQQGRGNGAQSIPAPVGASSSSPARMPASLRDPTRAPPAFGDSEELRTAPQWVLQPSVLDILARLRADRNRRKGTMSSRFVSGWSRTALCAMCLPVHVFVGITAACMPAVQQRRAAERDVAGRPSHGKVSGRRPLRPACEVKRRRKKTESVQVGEDGCALSHSPQVVATDGVPDFEEDDSDASSVFDSPVSESDCSDSASRTDSVSAESGTTPPAVRQAGGAAAAEDTASLEDEEKRLVEEVQSVARDMLVWLSPQGHLDS